MTDAERAMWKHLRAHRMNGYGFRRQKPIGPYIVDFVCEAARLIVEIDGGQHYQNSGLALDKRRDAFLGSAGYSVMRFDNIEVLTNTTGVLEAIFLSLKTRLPLPASPASGGGEDKVAP